MKRTMMLLLALLFSAGLGVAQKLNTSSMATSGQSGSDQEARWILGRVINEQADLLNNYFNENPTSIEAIVDVYTDSSQNASISTFCVAVDLGNVDVVKAFVEHGIGRKTLCRVQTFSTKVIVSKAELLIDADSSSSTSSKSSSSSGSSSSRRSWFGRNTTSKSYSNSSSSSSADADASVHVKYQQVAYGEKKVVKTYFANPLDFATGEMFDYLWEQGFRSNNLFTLAALKDARNTGRTEVYNYILDNKPEMLKTEPSYISEETYNQLFEAARENPDSFATELLIRDVLGIVKSSSKAKALRGEVDELMQEQLANQVADTVGYAAVVRELAARESQLKRQEQQRVHAYRDEAVSWKKYRTSEGEQVFWNPNSPEHFIIRRERGTYTRVSPTNWDFETLPNQPNLAGYEEIK
ncbi:MAG: hypothetical protein MJ053_02885 [Elusimicrobiaceae bacterium]|nr:hypothetical protein [Elusimicrobiaceae bacterium]